MIVIEIDRNGRNLPNFVTIFLNCTVRREFARARCIENRHARPLLRISVLLPNAILTINIGLEIRQQQKGIVIQQIINNWLKEFPISLGKITRCNEIDDLFKFAIVLIIFPGVITRLAEIDDFLCG